MTIFRSNLEPVWVIWQEAVKNARQTDPDLRSSPNGDSRSNGLVNEADGMIRTWKVFVQVEMNVEIDNQRVLSVPVVAKRKFLTTQRETRLFPEWEQYLQSVD